MEKEAEGFSQENEERKGELPKTPFEHIAISLSGGGFRATAFHLGVFSYLSDNKWKGISLLERTRILSTVSAGTFTGVKYAASLKKGEDIKSCYKNLYAFLAKDNLVDEALTYLSDDDNWKNGRQRTLINAFASMYHKEFEQETFGLLWKESPEIHLKEISFNATEFHFALPFRFQKTEMPKQGNHNLREYIGNKKIQIPIEVAKEVRLADITAASSCFPFGFEPIDFPEDFIYEGCEKLKDRSLLPQNVYDGDKIEYPIGLMDGGIDDNQGVDAVVLAEERMKKYSGELKKFTSDDKKSVDLYLICDVTVPRMESYTSRRQDKIRVGSSWNFQVLRYFGITSFVVGIVSIICAFFADGKLATMGLTVFGTSGIFSAFALLIFSMGFAGITKRLGVSDYFAQKLRKVDQLKFGLLYKMLINRRRSVMKMVSKVFLKQIRWFSYERVYGDAQWKTRLIMNAVFELTEEEVEKRKKKYNHLSEEILNPGPEIMETAEKGYGMGTTLWFTPKELEGEKNMLNTLIACGQFTMCFNLIEYIEKYFKNKEYLSDYEKYSPETKQEIDKLYENLL
ncbi:MAG TPA: patatin-like phospholipase family protein, partial [Bacteroidia bacterium]|nr:patatin-like phospholipase family protein [Bacteroidia bacterium]